MKRMLFMFTMLLVSSNIACIEDGPLPPEKTPDAAVPTAADASESDAYLPPMADAAEPAMCPYPPPTLTFTADPIVITIGETSTLIWTSTNVVDFGCIGSWETWELNGAGTASVSPTVNTIYELWCRGFCGSVVQRVTVIVNTPPPVDAASVIPDAATIPPDAARSIPDAGLPLPVDATTPTPDACSPPTDASPIPPVVYACHGLVVRFSTDDVAAMHHCTGWSASGSAALLPPQTEIVGADGVCAITCNRGESGDTVVPSQCSGVWLPGATADVSRWYTAGCRRLPDHPASEPDQAGCTWDKRCDLY